jgi:hypothetical protein
MSSKHCHMWLTNFCLKKHFWKSQLLFIFACIFALVSTLPFSLFQSTKQGKEKALCDALKCCGHEELFPFYLSCNKCIVGKSSQLSVKGRNSVKQSPRQPLNTLPVRKYCTKGGNFQKIEDFGKTFHNYTKKIKI